MFTFANSVGALGPRAAFRALTTAPRATDRRGCADSPSGVAHAYAVPMTGTDTALSSALTIGLAASVRFRVFLPLLVASVAAWTGHLHLDGQFAWLGSLTAVTMLGVAAVVEVAAYYIPAVDNLLDTITTPLALVAGTVVSAAV